MQRLSDRAATLICRRPAAVIVAAAVLAIASIGLTASRLEFQSNRNDLIDPDIDWNRRYIDWWESFPNSDDLLVIIDAGQSTTNAPATQSTVRDAARRLADRLGNDNSIEQVFWGAWSSEWSPRTVRLLPTEQFERRVANALQARPLLESADAASYLSTVVQSMRAEMATAPPAVEADSIIAGIQRLAEILRAIERVALGAEHGAFRRSIGAEDDTWEPLRTEDGRLTLLRITPRKRAGALLASDEAIAATRRAIAAVAPEFPQLDIGLTGVEVIESDETSVAARDSALASLLAMLLISALLILSLRSVVVPILLTCSLLVGVAWSFGFLTVSIGHLQVLSIVFVVILLGLGIDFGIHLVSSLERVRADHPEHEGFAGALADAYQRCGPGILIGAATTAAAFLATTLTDFTGVAEMGLIAAGGIVLCVIAMMTVAPALLCLLRHRREHLRAPTQGGVDVFRDRWIIALAPGAVPIIAMTIVLLIAAAFSMQRVRFDEDLMSLLPRNVDSVLWQQRLMKHSERAIWHGVSIADSLDEAATRADRFRALPTVAGVGGIGEILPEPDDDRVQFIEDIRSALQHSIASVRASDPTTPTSGGEPDSQALLGQLEAVHAELSAATQFDALPAGIRTAIMSAHQAAQASVLAFKSLNEGEQIRAVARLNQELHGAQHEAAGRIESMLDTSPLSDADVPAEFIRAAVDRSDPDAPRYALFVYPALPVDGTITSPLAAEFLPGFVADMRSVDPDVTGVPVQIHESGDLIKNSFVRIGVLALLAVLVLTWLAFRSFIDALLALTPTAVGFTLTFGALGLIGVNLNPANIIVLPLMFGIGVDAGIHMVHRARAHPNDSPPGLAHGTGKAITLTILTTMIGFASMMVARHRGIASLGFVMTLGLALTLAACWLVLPALLGFRARWRGGAAGESP